MKSYNVNEILSNIYIKKQRNISKILKKNTNNLYIIEIKNVKCPFGLEENKYVFNKKINKSLIFKIDLENKELEKYLENIETKLYNLQCLIDKKNYVLDSEILRFDNYNNKLITKVIEYNDKIITKVYKNNLEISLFDINKSEILDFYLTGNIFISKENKFKLKWNIKSICVK